MDKNEFEVLSIEDISTILNISYTKARILVRDHMKYLLVGRTYRVTKKSFLQFLNEGKDCSTESIHYKMNPY